jgi:hypothetical protein
MNPLARCLSIGDGKICRLKSMNESTELEWEIKPDLELRKKQLVGALGICFSVILAWVVFHSLLFLILASLYIFTSLSELYLAKKFKIDSSGVSIVCGISKKALSWEQIKRVQYLAKSVYVYPSERESVLSSFQALSLEFCDNEAEVISSVKRYFKSHESRSDQARLVGPSYKR